jgi:sugar lactone lactonase YvrE
MGADGIAISSDGARLYYCPLGSRKLYSVSTDALADQSLDEQKVSATIVDECDRGGASDGLESDAAVTYILLIMNIMLSYAEAQMANGKR